MKMGGKKILLLGVLLALVVVVAVYAGTYRSSEAAEPRPADREAFPASPNQTNYALQFDGVDDYAVAVDNGTFESAGFEFSADTWQPGGDGCCYLHIRPGG